MIINKINCYKKSLTNFNCRVPLQVPGTYVALDYKELNDRGGGGNTVTPPKCVLGGVTLSIIMFIVLYVIISYYPLLLLIEA